MKIVFYNRKERNSKKVSYALIDGKRSSQKKASEELAKHSGRVPTNISHNNYYTILTYEVPPTTETNLFPCGCPMDKTECKECTRFS